MKRINAATVAGLVLLTVEAFAGNGDLIVDGKIGIGTTTPPSPLSIGSTIAAQPNPSLVGSQMQINDSPTSTASGNQASVYVVTQPNVSANSSASQKGIFVESITPSTAWNYNQLVGIQGRTDHYGSGLLNSEYGAWFMARNQSSGTVTSQGGSYHWAYNDSTGVVTNQMGLLVSALNASTGSVTTQYGVYARGQNYSTGTVGTTYGAYIDAYNKSTGTITTAYGLAIGNATQPAIYNPSGTVTTGYGLYLGNVQATNKWSLYSSDATAPSYFAGNVGIGTNTPSFKLDVIGQVASNGVALTSDARFKKDLLPIESPLDKILNLNGLSYAWKTYEYKERNFPEGRHYGVIAQEIEKVLPEVVSTTPDGSKSVAYTEIIPVLIEAIKEQQKRIEVLEKKLTEIH